MNSTAAAEILLARSVSAPPDPAGARMPAAAEAVQKFERLMYAPGMAPQAPRFEPHAAAGMQGGLGHHIEELSRRWELGQSALRRVMDTGAVSAKDLVLTQMQMIHCALDVEVSSKCASMFENGVQTLIQRGS